MTSLNGSSKRILDLQDLIIDFISIERLIFLPDRSWTDRKENNAEHSYSLALAAWFLSSYFSHLDKDLLIRYALVHDLVEVHAGDEQAIGRSAAADEEKAKRERQALTKLIKDWPDFSDMTDHIKAYEKRSDPESRFIYALDKLMPMLLNILSEGKTIKAYNFTLDEILTSKDAKIAESPEVYELWTAYREYIKSSPHLFNNQGSSVAI